MGELAKQVSNINGNINHTTSHWEKETAVLARIGIEPVSLAAKQI